MSRATAASTVRDALAAATDAIAAAGSDTRRLDAELLLEEATGWSSERLAAEPEARLAPKASRAFAEMVRRRVRREPVAYILGRKGFRRIELTVDRRALIPRPETELLVDVAVELARSREEADVKEPLEVLDVGTGSGAVALAVADELPDCRVVATDTSAEALELARANAEPLGLIDRVRFERGMLPAAASSASDRGRDLLLANLPYVSEAEWEGLAPEIREYEPREALVAGPTGLEAIEALLAEVQEAESRPGVVALEVGAGQPPAVAELLESAGYRGVERRRDLAGIERVVSGALAVPGEEGR